jgi:diaminopimelate decarboxylase
MNDPRRAHAAPLDFPVVEGCLQIGGLPLTRLAARVGRTPFFAYDRALITARVQSLRSHLPAAVRLHYAVKANPMPAVVQHLAGLVDGFDVASAGEMRIALDTPMKASEISFAGPGKTEAELACAVAAGVTINIESEHELRRIARLAGELRLRPRIAVRINPDFELRSAGMKMGGGPKPFGIDAERVPEVLAEMGGLEVEFVGFHIFTGSQNLRAEAIVEAQEKTLDLACRLAPHCPGPIRKLNIGGGFGIPYFPGEKPLDLALIGRRLGELMPEVKRRLPAAEVIIELGRYLVGEAGIYVCKVIDRKISRGQVFLVTDGGLHHHLAASGNFGQVIRKNYPVAVGNRMDAVEREIVSVVGPLCTPLDVLADKMEQARAEPGDLIVIFQSGAYGLTASPTRFLSHEPAQEVLV